MRVTVRWRVFVAWAVGACAAGDPAAAPAGDPLPGLSAAELERFARGQALFNRAFTPEEGLGPLFNQDRCSSCHDLPTSGGTGEEAAVLATRFEPPDRCDLLRDEGGHNIQQRATPLLRAHGVERERTPRRATAQSHVLPPALYGLGLVEAVPEAALRARADPDDADGDGISGRLGRTADGRLGRFGRKADFATLREFVAEALLVELGLTTPDRPHEETVNGAPLPPGVDPAPDPEMDEAALELLFAYVRMLAPPASLPPTSREDAGRRSRGERLFHAIGCAACHVPELRTGRHPHPAYDRKTVRLYSDFLLHDLGPEAAGICGVGAGPSEFRTARLVGLRHRVAFLHDGRAGSVWGAVMLHGGEAAAARAAFTALNPTSVEALLAFLGSL